MGKGRCFSLFILRTFAKCQAPPLPLKYNEFKEDRPKRHLVICFIYLLKDLFFSLTLSYS